MSFLAQDFCLSSIPQQHFATKLPSVTILKRFFTFRKTAIVFSPKKHELLNNWNFLISQSSFRAHFLQFVLEKIHIQKSLFLHFCWTRTFRDFQSTKEVFENHIDFGRFLIHITNKGGKNNCKGNIVITFNFKIN